MILNLIIINIKSGSSNVKTIRKSYEKIINFIITPSW